MPKIVISKEDAQKLLVGAMIAVGILVAFWQFAWKPLGTKIAARKKELAEVRKTYEEAKRLTDVADEIATRYEAVRTRLGQLMKAQLPPPVNATAWASDLFMQTAVSNRKGVTIISIGDRGVQRLQHRKNTPPPLFEECLFQVTLTAGYHDFGRFLAQLEKNNPFFRVESLSLSRAPSKEEHLLAVNMSCAFPRLTLEGFPPEERPDAESPHVRAKAESK
ncbi:MAG: hypothetical protein GXP31_12900 [Kiritimatiellaeota bacterium]|nr:hypothetical protein [Kiritimatiellota bacterium]